MKHAAYASMTCPQCHGYLIGHSIKINTKHMYPIGQFWDCRCGKAKCWTNSVRGDKALLDYIQGNTDRYWRGFCNDLFCGYCYKYLQPLQNGFQYEGKSFDLYGCTKCKQNRIVVDLRQFLPEGSQTTQKLIDWYKRHLEEFQKAVEWLNGPDGTTN